MFKQRRMKNRAIRATAIALAEYERAQSVEAVFIPDYLTNSRFSAEQFETGGNVFGDEVRVKAMDETGRILDGKGF